jgi:hypothetical protein
MLMAANLNLSVWGGYEAIGNVFKNPQQVKGAFITLDNSVRKYALASHLKTLTGLR